MSFVGGGGGGTKMRVFHELQPTTNTAARAWAPHYGEHEDGILAQVADSTGREI